MIELRMEATDENRRFLVEILNARCPVTIAGRENMVLTGVEDGPAGIVASFVPITVLRAA